jgi:hypothetical protein
MIIYLLTLAVVTATNPGGFPNSLGRLPPRGVRTWNSFRQRINQDLLTLGLDGLVAELPAPANGSLASSRYLDLGIDDGYEACINGTFHDSAGNPMINKTLFPDMAALTAHAHSKGLTMSWYMNCCGCSERKSTIGPHYAQDAAATARLGFSGLKVDGCGNEPNISEWAVALNATGEPILLENCNDDDPFRPTTSAAGVVNCPYNIFRTSIDGAPNIRSTFSNVWATLPYLNVSSPGCFAYPDMLTFGSPAYGFEEPSFYHNCGGRRMSDDEARIQFAAFATLSSPLVLGFDTGNASERARWAPIVTHAPTLEVNDAWDGEAGRLVAASSVFEVVPVAVGGMCELILNYTLPQWAVIGKKLASHDDGTTALFAAVLMVGDWAPTSVPFEAPLSAMGFAEGATVAIIDGWTRTSYGNITGAWTGETVKPGLYRIFETVPA